MRTGFKTLPNAAPNVNFLGIRWGGGFSCCVFVGAGFSRPDADGPVPNACCDNVSAHKNYVLFTRGRITKERRHERATGSRRHFGLAAGSHHRCRGRGSGLCTSAGCGTSGGAGRSGRFRYASDDARLFAGRAAGRVSRPGHHHLRSGVQRASRQQHSHPSAVDGRHVVRGTGLVQPGSVPGLERYPQQPSTPVAGGKRAGFGLPVALEQQQREHLRLPGPPDLL